jgi:hypothetical protein
MAWPQTPATTTDLDAGTDNPELARPQLKLNIENSNAMANEFGDVAITSPTDTQVLAYNTANSRWQNADATGGGGGGSVAYLSEISEDGSTETIDGESRYPINFSELKDDDGIITITNGDELTFPSGTYEMLAAGMRCTSSTDEAFVGFFNTTADTNIEGTFLNGRGGASMINYFTSNGTDVHKFAHGGGGIGTSGSIAGNWTVKFTQLS